MNHVERRFSRAGLGRYVLDVPDLCVLLDLDRVRRDRWGALRGELTVRCDLPGVDTIDGNLAWSGELTISDTRGRADVLRALEPRVRARGLNWSVLLDELGMRVRDAERAGDPAILLRDAVRPSPDEHLRVDGLSLLKRHPTIIFGDGGSAKSYLALYLAGRLAQSRLKVALFDWELEAEDHRLRLERLFGSDMPPILYARCSKPLVDEVDRLARTVHSHKIEFGIFDSIAFACDGPPEAAEVAGNYLRAVRSLGIGSLNLAHISKADGGDQKPFGSAFWHNGARSTWFAKLADGHPGDPEVTVGLFNRKANLGPRLPAVGFAVRFEDERTTFSRVDLADVDTLAGRLSTYERITAALKRGPMTVAALAEEIEAKVDTCEKTVKRWVSKGHLIRLDAKDGTPTRYGLREARRAS
ncbi:MAG: hypothetical protein FJW39_32195 [Acidobacteria bacterium]|nr:hypothetical protein [Acidobacteriota bacterium]